MTIGPDPISMTVLMSVLRGMGGWSFPFGFW